MRQRSLHAPGIIARLTLSGLGLLAGCRSTHDYREDADRRAAAIINTTQKRALGRTEPVRIETPADTLRRRLLLDHHLPHKGAASLGLRDLPDTRAWDGSKHLDAAGESTEPSRPGRLTVGLLTALQISARNNRDYQDAKESVYQAALDLDLESDAFRHTFTGLMSGEVAYDGSGDDATTAGLASGGLGFTRTFRNGLELSGRIVVDLVKLLTQDRSSSLGLFADASVSIPLLRGAGTLVVAEPLKQAEKDMLYAVYEFERTKRTLAVKVASEYFSVLQQRKQVQNARENYQRLIASARRARRLADAGRLPEFQYDQSVQDELRARTRWISARQNYASSLDSFKLLLGLPPDADIELDADELNALYEYVMQFTGSPPDTPTRAPEQADASLTPREPDQSHAGPYEMEVARAIELALSHRLDLKAAEGAVEDAQRAVTIAADALRAEITFLAEGSAGERRSSAGSADEDDAGLRPSEGSHSALIDIDLPFERTSERNDYRNSLISLNQAVRTMQELEDQIKLQVRDRLRDLQESRENLQIQLQAVELAEKRVHSTDLFLQAGRVQIRDVLESQDALLSAQNALSAAVVSYRTAELTLQRDLGLLQVSEDGLWKEYTPGNSDHANNTDVD